MSQAGIYISQIKEHTTQINRILTLLAGEDICLLEEQREAIDSAQENINTWQSDDVHNLQKLFED